MLMGADSMVELQVARDQEMRKALMCRSRVMGIMVPLVAAAKDPIMGEQFGATE